MLIEHEGRRPRIDPTAWIAPNAIVSGDVRIGAECRVLFGAVVTDDGGPVQLRAGTIVMENALVRGRANHPALVAAASRRYAEVFGTHRFDRPLPAADQR